MDKMFRSQQRARPRLQVRGEADHGWRRRDPAPTKAERPTDEPIVFSLPAPEPAVEPVRDAVALRSFNWVWAAWPYVQYQLAVRPAGDDMFDCAVRYSDLVQLEQHHTMRTARADGAPFIPPLPPAHSVPVLGKLMDTEDTSRSRGMDMQLYLTAVLGAGGGLRATAIDLLRARAAVAAEEPV
jgi:hypothetical protein